MGPTGRGGVVADLAAFDRLADNARTRLEAAIREELERTLRPIVQAALARWGTRTGASRRSIRVVVDVRDGKVLVGVVSDLDYVDNYRPKGSPDGALPAWEQWIRGPLEAEVEALRGRLQAVALDVMTRGS
jgi:predicted nucleic acid-binding protein